MAKSLLSVLIVVEALATMVHSKHLEFSLYRGHDSRRRRMLEEEGFTELASIKREPDGVYWSDLKIGNPAQMFSVIVDTGSSTIAVPCKGCSCGNHNHFDVALSPGSQVMSSSYSQCYSEGSCNRGRYVTAKMCLGENCDVEKEGVEHNFGCCDTFASAFKNQEADGIIGMSGSDRTLLAQLRKQHKLEHDMFSLCLSSTVGVLGVGGYDSTRHLEPIQWVPMTFSEFYSVKVNDIYIGGEKLNLPGLSNPIVDSGTTFTYVPYTAHEKLKAALDAHCNSSPDACKGIRNPSSALSMDRRDSIGCFAPPADQNMNDLTNWLESFPTMEFEFDSKEKPDEKVRICVPSSSYLFRSAGNAFCVGILKGSSRFVLGAITMSGFDMVFDHSKNRLGIARSICNKKNDNDSSYRTSGSFCCGTCKTAQENGYNQGTRTPAPTPFPTTRGPTASPTPKVTHGSNTTEDGMFYVSTSDQFPGKTIFTPVKAEVWTDGERTFEDNHVLMVSSSGVVGLTKDNAWRFSEESTLVISGHDTKFSAGPYADFGYVRVDQGATFKLEEESMSRRELVKSSDSQKRTGFHNMVTFTTGVMIIKSGAAAEFSGKGNITSSLTSTLEVEKGASLYCGSHQKDVVFFGYGRVDIRAPAHIDCFLATGQHATLSVHPDVEKGLPVNFLQRLQIQGTFVTTINRNPFVSFTVLSNGTFIWDHHFDTVFRIELDENVGTELAYLPEVSRVITVAKGGIQDAPTKVDLPSEFRCSNSTLDPLSIGQLRFTSLKCFNLCITEKNYECTAEEMEDNPWPPQDPDLPEVIPDAEKGDHGKDDITHQFGLDDPDTYSATMGGIGGGVVLGLVVFIILYPPPIFRRWCNRTR